MDWYYRHTLLAALPADGLGERWPGLFGSTKHALEGVRGVRVHIKGDADFPRGGGGEGAQEGVCRDGQGDGEGQLVVGICSNK